MADRFSDAAARLWGVAASLLGWRAQEFWESTPIELAGALSPPGADAGGADRPLLEALQRQFPDN